MTSTRGPIATLVTVGNELLYGETVDTNAAWLGRALAQLGFDVARTYTVGDDPDDIRGAVEAGMGGSDLVLVSGGLGPTPDDLTKEAVARLLGYRILLDEHLLEALAARFRARGYDRLPASNRSQAEVPEGALVLKNPQGTAPGLGLEADQCIVVLLPGVPRELRAIFEGDLTTLLLERFAQRLDSTHHRVIHTTGVAESRLSELVTPLLPDDLGPLSLAFLPDLWGVDLRLTA
jgi:nicotinamide-nucleotide amidase